MTGDIGAARAGPGVDQVRHDPHLVSRAPVLAAHQPGTRRVSGPLSRNARSGTAARVADIPEPGARAPSVSLPGPMIETASSRWNAMAERIRHAGRPTHSSAGRARDVDERYDGHRPGLDRHRCIGNRRHGRGRPVQSIGFIERRRR